MKSMGFNLVRCDYSIWVYRRDEVRIIIPVYVDDMTIAVKSKQQYESVRDELAKHFKLHELGPTSFLLVCTLKGIALSTLSVCLKGSTLLMC